jgi:hypothetical protein
MGDLPHPCMAHTVGSTWQNLVAIQATGFIYTSANFGETWTANFDGTSTASDGDVDDRWRGVASSASGQVSGARPTPGVLAMSRDDL